MKRTVHCYRDWKRSSEVVGRTCEDAIVAYESLIYVMVTGGHGGYLQKCCMGMVSRNIYHGDKYGLANLFE